MRIAASNFTLTKPARCFGSTRSLIELLSQLPPCEVILIEDRWIGLEGVIVDPSYLEGVRRIVPRATKRLTGYAVGTEDLSCPPIEWRGSDTFIQRTGINQDFGVYDDPDAFYAAHGNNLRGVRAWLYGRWVRHALNRNVAKIRARGAHAPEASLCSTP